MDADQTRLQSSRPQIAGMRFQILRPHAEGGIGQVFLAQDGELHRQVALKEIMPCHADDQESRARFVQEAEITGQLEHPGIVPVYGMGRYPDGRPYYAMRFIPGQNLQEALDRFHKEKAPGAMRGITFRQLLRRFLDVCNAVAYAYSRGILHRDLKPSNIMLGQFGETLVVDWGLAKAMDQTEAALTIDKCNRRNLSTVQSGLLKPRSSSEPTQHGRAIGTPAFMSPEQAAGKVDELGPTTDVYSLGAVLYVILTGRAPFDGDIGAVLRRVQMGDFPDPRRVNSQTPRALEAVCQKAMARRPADRYPTALALAADVEHWLSDEPVTAHADAFAERLARWARSHRSLVVGVSATILVAVITLSAANLALLAANSRERFARQQAAEKAQEASQQRDLAHEHYQVALDALNELVFGIQNQLYDRPASQELRSNLLDKASQGLQKLLGNSDHQPPGAHVALIWVHLHRGDMALQKGATAEAHQDYEAARRVANDLVTAEPASAQARRELAVCHEKTGDILLMEGDCDGAFGAFRAGLAISKQLSVEQPRSSQAQRDLSVSHAKIGDVLVYRGDAGSACQSYGAALKIHQALATAEPNNRQAQRDLAFSYSKIGSVLLQLNDTQSARVAYRAAMENRRKLADADPTCTNCLRDLSLSHDSLGDVALRRGDHAAALTEYRAAKAIRTRLASGASAGSEAQRDLSVSENKVGEALLLQGDVKNAVEAFRQGLEISRKRADADSASLQARRDLSVCYNKLGNALLRLGNSKAALDAYLAAFEIDRKLAAANPASSQAQRDWLISCCKLGNWYEHNGGFARAIGLYEKALQIANRFKSSRVFASEISYVKRRLAGCRHAESTKTAK
jgi:serine/threonine-protein kinase